ncbi:MAG: hypothetical protein ABFR02_01980 [Campylobacterota bacterium]
MLNVLELEVKWSKYHFKKMLPVYIISSLLVLVAGASSYFYLMQPKTVSTLVKKELPPVKAQTVVKVDTTVVEVNKSVKPVQTVEIQEVYEQNVLVPSFSFISLLDEQVIEYQNAQRLASIARQKAAKKKRAKKKKAKPKPKKRTKQAATSKKAKKVPAKTQKAITPEVKQVVKDVPVQTIIIGGNSNATANEEPPQALFQLGKKNTSEDELKSVIKRFNKSEKPALGLFIAKKYYDQGKYEEAYKYAKQTYRLNPNIEDGVVLYSQCLAKLGKSDIAVSRLKAYIKKSGSIKARALLNEIQKGNFK